MPASNPAAVPLHSPASEDEIRLERLRQRRQRYPLIRLLRANLHDSWILGRQAWVPISMLAVLLLGSALYLRLAYFPALCAAVGERCAAEGDFWAALYATMLLLVFEEPLHFPQDFSGRLIFFGVPLFGLFFLLQSVVDFARMLFDKGARHESWQISLASTFSGHVVVCGIGHVGYRVVLQLLDAGHEVVAIDSDGSSEFAPIIARLHVPLLTGDARDPYMLHLAGIMQARGLVATISDDLRNVEIALTARRQRPELPTVLRIFNRELDRNLERSFGRNSAFSATALAAPTLAAAAISRDIAHVVSLPEGLLALSELSVAAGSALCGSGKASEQHFDVRIIRLRDAAGRERECRCMARLNAGDRVLLLGTIASLEHVRLANMGHDQTTCLSAVPSPQRPTEHLNTVIICGLGKVGTEMVYLLARLKPAPQLVAICQLDTSQRLIANLTSLGVRVMLGDARDPAILIAAGLEQAYAVAAVVSDDLTNLQVALTARKLRPAVHLVLRVFSDVLAERFSALFGINTTYSTSALAAPTLAAAAILREVDHAFDVGARLFATETFWVGAGDGLAGASVLTLREQHDLLVTALRRAGVATLLPPHDLCLEPGDEVVLLADLKALARLRLQKEQAAS